MSREKKCDRSQTCCYATAECLFQRLTNHKVDMAKMDFDIEIENSLHFLNPTTTYIENFWDTTTPQHTIYLISIEGAAHNLIIEKYVSKTQHFWRIIQSWKGRYSVWQWLGIDPYVKKDIYKGNITRYGSFKKLNKQQLQEAFMDKDITYEYIHEVEISIYSKPFQCN